MIQGNARHRGVSLLELVIVLVIIAMAVPVLLAAFNVSLRGVGIEAESVRVAHIGQQRLEILLAAKRDGQIELGAGAQQCQEDGEQVLSDFDTEPPEGYAYSFTCLAPADEADPFEFQVEVTGPRTESARFMVRVYDLAG